MRPLFIVAALALLPGCDAFSVPNINSYYPDMAQLDECMTAPAGRSCLTLHITGAVDPIDNLQIDAIFQLGTGYVGTRTVSMYPGAAVKPPIAVGVILDPDAGDDVEIKVLARNGTTPVGLGSNDNPDVGPGDHLNLAITLQAPDKTRCFNGIQDSPETDVDCGWAGACPLCTVGQVCISPQDCANALCVYNSESGDYQSHCQLTE